MTTKAKTLLKVGIPLVIVIQLISITFLLARLNRDKAFSCKTAREYLVCRQVELPWQRQLPITFILKTNASLKI